MCKTWPLMDDLLIPFSENDSDFPKALREKLRERYDAHGLEYATDDFLMLADKTAIPVNACMSANTINDIEDELVDAIFNGLVLLLKLRHQHDMVIKTVGQQFELPADLKDHRHRVQRLMDFLLFSWDKLEKIR